MHKWILSGVLIGLTVCACEQSVPGGGETPAPTGVSATSPDVAGPPADNLVESTVVSRGADGAIHSRTTFLTPEEMAEELEAKAKAAANPEEYRLPPNATAILDGGCAIASLWIYSGANQTGNRICFADDDSTYHTDHLKDFCALQVCSFWCVCVQTWDSAAVSFWGGKSKGQFLLWHGVALPSDEIQRYQAYERNNLQKGSNPLTASVIHPIP
jgi:hypothetical protein